MEVLFHPWPLPPLFLWKILYLLERLTSNAIFAKIVIFFKSLKSGKRLESPSNYFLERDVVPLNHEKLLIKGNILN